MRRVSELPWRQVTKPGGSTIHVEEATGLRDVLIADSVANHSILASSAINMTIQNCTILGQLVGNLNTDMHVIGNTIIATGNGSMASFLTTQGGTVRGNTFLSEAFPFTEGVYFWFARHTTFIFWFSASPFLVVALPNSAPCLQGERRGLPSEPQYYRGAESFCW
eukprot:SAG22_NODE_146_length_17566_cov_17.597847_9_plen_165_part_00